MLHFLGNSGAHVHKVFNLYTKLHVKFLTWIGQSSVCCGRCWCLLHYHVISDAHSTVVYFPSRLMTIFQPIFTLQHQKMSVAPSAKNLDIYTFTLRQPKMIIAPLAKNLDIYSLCGNQRWLLHHRQRTWIYIHFAATKDDYSTIDIEPEYIPLCAVCFIQKWNMGYV